ncbi:YbdD/YjiX family protein [Phenylobacterium sp.]|uniref:YbdD/YjiX family protein n=1 Tax=Phenylobacterium sp. TaxID=1871053 RepID=UPI002FC6F130
MSNTPSPFRAFARCVCEGARLMVGVPDYQAYCAHVARSHPNAPPMTSAEFFRDRQDARYRGDQGGFRCC